jgi:hypothetical protein
LNKQHRRQRLLKNKNMIGREATVTEDFRDSIGRVKAKKGTTGIITTEPDGNECIEFRPKGRRYIVPIPITSLKLKPINAINMAQRGIQA